MPTSKPPRRCSNSAPPITCRSPSISTTWTRPSASRFRPAATVSVPSVVKLTRPAVLLIALMTLAGCASSGPQVQRATQGPRADEIYLMRFLKGYGRPPSFDETMAWREDFDQRVAEYISRQPGMIVSPRVTQFRVQRRVAVGMTKEEVTLLVGLP